MKQVRPEKDDFFLLGYVLGVIVFTVILLVLTR